MSNKAPTLGRVQLDRTRRKMQSTAIAQRVAKAAMGDTEMTLSELRAAEMILSRTVPKLAAVDASPDAEASGDVHAYTPEQLLRVIEGEGKVVDNQSLTDEGDEPPHGGLFDGGVDEKECIPPLPNKKKSYAGPYVGEKVRKSVMRCADELNSPGELLPAPEGYVYGKPSNRGQSVPLVKIGSAEYDELVAEGFIEL